MNPTRRRISVFAHSITLGAVAAVHGASALASGAVGPGVSSAVPNRPAGCMNPAQHGISPVCTSTTYCLQTLAPSFDQQLNLGIKGTPGAAADYPCMIGGENVCQQLLPSKVTQTLHLSGTGGLWQFEDTYNGSTSTSAAISSTASATDIQDAVKAWTGNHVGGFTVAGTGPEFTLTYHTEPSIALGDGLQVWNDVKMPATLSAPTGVSVAPASSMLCAPTSDAMAIQALINYHPCEVSASAERGFLKAFNFPYPGPPQGVPAGAFHVPVIHAIHYEASVNGTDPVGGGGDSKGIDDAAPNFVGAVTGNWWPGLLAYDGKPNTFDGTTAAYLSMRKGFLNVQCHGFYSETDDTLGNLTQVSFVRKGGHCMAPVGYKATPNATHSLKTLQGTAVPDAVVSGTPYSLLIHNPEDPGVIETYKPGLMTGGTFCYGHPAPNDWENHPQNVTLSECVDIELPGGGTIQDFLSDSAPSAGGHSFTFVDGYLSIGIPMELTAPVSVPIPQPTLGPLPELGVESQAPGPAELALSESAVDTARSALSLDSGTHQALSALSGAPGGWGSRLARLYLAPKLAAKGGKIDISGLEAGYRALALNDPSGFMSAVASAYQELNREPSAASGAPALRWSWLHPRHAARALLLEYAARVGASIPAVRDGVQALASAEALQAPSAPVIDPAHASSEEQRDIAHSLAGAMITPAVAYGLVAATLSADEAIAYTVNVLKHQPHFAVRNAVLGRFKRLFPGSILKLAAALQAAGQDR